MTKIDKATRKARLLRLATYASVATALILIGAKLSAWLATGSVSMMASLVDSLMDAGASLVNLIAVHYSLMPPDEEHRFGHGKAEALAALGQATFIAGSAIFLLLHAGDRLLNPQPLAELGMGMVVILFAVFITLMLLALQHYVIKRTGSSAIRADALHYRTDLLTNGATLLALWLASRGVPGVDALFAIGIAVYILYSAGLIARDAIHQLMDRELPEKEQEEIMRLAITTPGVRGLHGLRTWQTGQRKVIQMHLELDDDLPLIEAHRIAVAVDKRLHEYDPEADVIIHQDPVGVGDEDRHDGAVDIVKAAPK